jgi:mycothiol synthase
VARLVKTESLRLLAADRPGVTRVVTTNAATNAPMLAVNRRLGFVPVTVWTGTLLSVR